MVTPYLTTFTVADDALPIVACNRRFDPLIVVVNTASSSEVEREAYSMELAIDPS